MGTVRRLVLTLLAAWCVAGTNSAQAANPWDSDPAVQEVLKIRQQAILAMTTTGPTPESERYSSTFVANTPGGGVVNGEQMRAAFARGSVKYAEVEMTLEYAGSHGKEVVVLMGEEIVVPGAGARNAGERIRRRFTDIVRKENGEWRHDVRHSSVIPAAP
jgi:ABC-type sugar transport system substrate-binding protein